MNLNKYVNPNNIKKSNCPIKDKLKDYLQRLLYN